MKQVKNKQYENVRGFVCMLNSMKIIPSEFIVSVSNDSHCTLSICSIAAPDIQYSIDFTDIVKDLKI